MARPDDEALALAAALAQASAHPFSKAIRRAAEVNSLSLPKLSDLKELPGSGVQATWNGKLVRLGSAEWTDASERNGAAAWL